MCINCMQPQLFCEQLLCSGHCMVGCVCHFELEGLRALIPQISKANA
jgi:hypothetical protein